MDTHKEGTFYPIGEGFEVSSNKEEDKLLAEMPAIVRMDLKESLLAQISDAERIVHKISAMEGNVN